MISREGFGCKYEAWKRKAGERKVRTHRAVSLANTRSDAPNDLRPLAFGNLPTFLRTRSFPSRWLGLENKSLQTAKVRVNTLNGTGESGDNRAEGWSGRGSAWLHRGEPLRCGRGCRSDEVRSVGKNEVRAGHGDENTQHAHENHVANPRSQQRPIYAAASLRWSRSLEGCTSLWASAGRDAVRAVS
jgi:hypothetical protein